MKMRNYKLLVRSLGFKSLLVNPKPISIFPNFIHHYQTTNYE